MELLRCFNCGEMLPMSDFDDNHRPYGIKSRKGKMFSCKQCTINWTVKNLKAVRYDFTENQFKVYTFDNEQDAMNFLNNQKMENPNTQECWAADVKKIKRKQRYKRLKERLPKIYDRILHFLSGIAVGYLIFEVL